MPAPNTRGFFDVLFKGAPASFEEEAAERQKQREQDAAAKVQADSAAQAEAARIQRIKTPWMAFQGAASGPVVGADKGPSALQEPAPPPPQPDPVAPPAPPPPPPTAKKAAPRVSVSTSSTGDLGKDFIASLGEAKEPLPPEHAQEATGTSILKPEAAPPDELALAQAKAQREAGMSHAGALFDRYASIISGAPSADATFARGEASAQQGVKDVLERRQAARQSEADKQTKALSDPSSDISQRATMLAQSRKLVPPGQRITAAEWGLIKDAGSMQEAADKLASEEKRTQAELAGRATEGEANRKNALQLERERMAAERRMHLDEINAKNEGKNGLKPMDAATVEKHAGAGPGADAVADAMEDFNKVAGFGMVGQDAAKYKTNSPSRALAAAVGRMPLARESLSANADHLTDTYMPKPSDTKETAAAKLSDQMTGIERGLRSRIDAFRHAGVDPAPLEGDLERVQKAKARFYKVANPYLPAAQRQVTAPEGKVHVANPKTGESYFVSPQDAEHARGEGFQVVQ